MYEIRVSTEFCAAHALIIAGAIEPTHGHNFRVTLTLAGERLDADGLLVDFHAVERWLAAIVRPFTNNDLSKVPPFDAPGEQPGKYNASAERIAQHIGDAMIEILTRELDKGTKERGVRVVSVEVTEARGCIAVYRPGC